MSQKPWPQISESKSSRNQLPFFGGVTFYFITTIFGFGSFLAKKNSSAGLLLDDIHGYLHPNRLCTFPRRHCVFSFPVLLYDTSRTFALGRVRGDFKLCNLRDLRFRTGLSAQRCTFVSAIGARWYKMVQIASAERLVIGGLLEGAVREDSSRES